MTKGGFRICTLAASVLAMVLILSGIGWAGEPSAAQAAGAAPPAAAAKLLAARAGVSASATTITLEINGAFTYHPAAAGEKLVFVDLPGVTSTQNSESRLVHSSLVSSYRLVPYENGGEPGVRLEILLKSPAVVSYEPGVGALQVRVASRGSVPLSRAVPAVVPVTASTPRSGKVLRATGDTIEDVTFEGGGDSARVNIVSNGPVDYHAFELSNPDRVVVDIPGTQSRLNKSFAAAASPLKAIRVAQFQRKPPVARVVLELDRSAPYAVDRHGNGLELRFGAPARPPAERRAVADAPAPAAPAEGRILTASLAPDTMARPAPDAPRADVPRRVVSMPERAPSRPASPPLAPMNVATAVHEAAVEVAAQRPPTPQPEPQTSSPGPAVPPMPAPGASAQTAMATRYTGEPISVNLKDVDLKDFFRLIHEISGLNMVLDPNVSGRVTIVLEDVPWDQALDIVLRNNSLDKQLEGNVLRIARRDTMQREEQERAALAQARQEAAERVTVMRPLSYARAQQLLAVVSKFRSTKGEMIADERTNTLIITDIPQVIPTIDEVLRNLDRRSVQVEIEARVVAASRSFSRDIGAQFGFGTTAAGGRTLFTGNLVGSQNLSPVSVSGLPQPFTVGGNTLPLFSNFPAAGASTGIGILHRSPNAAIDLLITAAETKGIGKLLSRPRIITQNNVQGMVQQGVKIPVQTTVNNTISVQFVDVTLRLSVRPQVTNEGTIFLDVTVANTTIDPGVARINGVPALDTQEATTQVLVSDGGTVVFGGVLQNQNNVTIQQVPILGSIPVIGNLFKRTGVNTNTNELLFFLTPRIV